MRVVLTGSPAFMRKYAARVFDQKFLDETGIATYEVIEWDQATGEIILEVTWQPGREPHI